MKLVLILISVTGDVIYRYFLSRALAAGPLCSKILVKGIMRNISVQ